MPDTETPLNQAEHKEHLWDVLNAVSRDKEKRLALDNHEQTIKVIPITAAYRLRSLFGANKSEQRKISALLKEKEETIHLIGKEKLKEGINIRKAQKVINKLFLSCGEKNPPDLYYEHYRAWMKKLPPESKNSPINKLILPATHDSGAYKIDYKNYCGKNPYAKIACFAARMPIIGRFVRNIMEDWTLAQHGSLYDQLAQGIRSFDLRISYNKKNDTFYLSHTFSCVPLDEGLDDIKRFLAKNPSEIVLIKAIADFENKSAFYDDDVHRKLIDNIQGSLGEQLLKETQNNTLDETVTLASMIKQNKQIVFCYDKRGYEDELPDGIWDAKIHIKEHWLNSSNMQKSVENIDETTEQLQHRSTEDMKKEFHDILFTRTPKVSELKTSVFKTVFHTKKRDNLQSFGKSMNKKVPAYTDRKEIKGIVSTVSMDHTDSTSPIDDIIKANH